MTSQMKQLNYNELTLSTSSWSVYVSLSIEMFIVETGAKCSAWLFTFTREKRRTILASRFTSLCLTMIMSLASFQGLKRIFLERQCHDVWYLTWFQETQDLEILESPWCLQIQNCNVKECIKDSCCLTCLNLQLFLCFRWHGEHLVLSQALSEECSSIYWKRSSLIESILRENSIFILGTLCASLRIIAKIENRGLLLTLEFKGYLNTRETFRHNYYLSQLKEEITCRQTLPRNV